MDQLHKLIGAHVADHHHLVGFVDLGQGGIDIGGETHPDVEHSMTLFDTPVGVEPVATFGGWIGGVNIFGSR